MCNIKEIIFRWIILTVHTILIGNTDKSYKFIRCVGQKIEYSGIEVEKNFC